MIKALHDKNDTWSGQGKANIFINFLMNIAALDATISYWNHPGKMCIWYFILAFLWKFVRRQIFTISFDLTVLFKTQIWQNISYYQHFPNYNWGQHIFYFTKNLPSRRICLHVKCNRIKFQEWLNYSCLLYSNNNRKQRNIKQQHKEWLGWFNERKKRKERSEQLANVLHRDSTNGSNYSVREKRKRMPASCLPEI